GALPSELNRLTPQRPCVRERRTSSPRFARSGRTCAQVATGHRVWHWRAASMGWHGNALLVPKAAEVIDCEVIHLPALEPRGAVMADLAINGQTIRVVGMHLDLSGLWRRRQAHAILTHVAASLRQHPTVMMGDLNEWTRAAGCLQDFDREFSFADTGPSFHARRPVGRLDRIMVSSGLKVVDCGVHASYAARKASDHLPIWADIAAA
ncbi:MAG: endonuclease/exonuclease/phosphatase family protein, partial [Sphingomonas sp.]|nr:endonuclease/exonuclease/phosphatase family protein [Sphingomonas sp.]